MRIDSFLFNFSKYAAYVPVLGSLAGIIDAFAKRTFHNQKVEASSSKNLYVRHICEESWRELGLKAIPIIGTIATIFFDLQRCAKSRSQGQAEPIVVKESTTEEPVVVKESTTEEPIVVKEPATKELEELFQCVDENIRNICKDVIGDNAHAKVIACLLCNYENLKDKIGNSYLKKGYTALTLGAILETFTGETGNLLKHSEFYIHGLGKILLKIEKEGLWENYFWDPLLEIFFVNSREDVPLGLLLVSDYDTDFLDPLEKKYGGPLTDYIKTQRYGGGSGPLLALRFILVLAAMTDEQKKEWLENFVSQFATTEKKSNTFLAYFSLLPGLSFLDGKKNLISICNRRRRCDSTQIFSAYFSLLLGLSAGDRKKNLISICKDPKRFKSMFSSRLTFEEISVAPNKWSEGNSGLFLHQLLSILSVDHLKKETKLSQQISEACKKAEKSPNATAKKINHIVIQGSSHIFGRTVLVDKKHAYKILKKGESLEGFRREKEILSVLSLSEHGFKSRLPIPGEISRISKEKIPKVTIEVSEEPSIYQFQTSYDYYCYLQTVTDNSAYQEARKNWLSDSLKLVANGWFHESTPMYHNQEQKRPYIVTPGLLRASNVNRMDCAGRLDTPRLLNQHPNVGKTGIRDVGDLRNIQKLAEKPWEFSDDLGDATDEKGALCRSCHDIEARKKMLTANFIATHRLVDTIILAMRLENDKTFVWDWTNSNSRKRLAEEGIRGMALTLSSYTGKKYSECESLARNGTVDWDQWAKEILFWWTPDQKDSYADWLGKGKLPEDLYPGAEINVAITGAKNYLPGFGLGNIKGIIENVIQKDVNKVNLTQKDMLNALVKKLNSYVEEIDKDERREKVHELKVSDEELNYLKSLRKRPEAKLYLDLGVYNSGILLNTLEIDWHLTAALSIILHE